MPSPTTEPKTVLELEAHLGETWAGIRAAKDTTEELRQRLTAALGSLADPNAAVVVTGSLGRGEANESSDADWILLVDGPSNPDHARMAREVDDAVAAAGFKAVGPTGTFGDVVASHDLVHYIAGTRDTNENLTRRMLLLSESYAISSPLVRERVLRNVLTRYVVLDRSVQGFHPIPHFLLNDVVRYWRTIASDYASKMWNRNKKGWATRNVKLRFSRKLLYAWGLLASFAGRLFPSAAMTAAGINEDDYVRHLADLIRTLTDVTPLDLVSRVASHADVPDVTKREIFGSYDKFISIMRDQDKRTRLDQIAFSEAASDPVYGELRELSHTFREGVKKLFFDEHPEIRQLIRQYGVF